MPREPDVEEAVKPASRHPASPRVLLAEGGYHVVFRADVWTECMVSRARERWIGYGDSEDEALADALKRMFPSALARAFLAERLAAMASASPPEDEATAAQAVETAAQAVDTAAQTVDTAAQAVETAAQGVDMAAHAVETTAHAVDTTAQGVETAAQTVETAAQGVETVAQTVETAAQTVDTAAQLEGARVGDAGAAPGKDSSPPGISRSAQAMEQAPALEALEVLRAEIERELPRLARLTAERQRLALLAWICRARTFEEALPEARPVVWTVQRIARRLTEISKMFWPGSVRALQLATGPEETLELGGGERGHATWVEAAKHAEQRLSQHIAEAASAGFDEDGWADAAARMPAPPEPEARMARVAAELEALSNPTGGATYSSQEVEALVRCAHTLRWLRGNVGDHVAWGITVGRLRRLLPALGAQGAVVRKALEPAFRPAMPWIRVLATRPENEVRPDFTAELRAELGEIGNDSDALFSWLVRAFDAFPTPDLAAMLRPRREQVSALSEVAAGHEDRRIRRRLRDLVIRLASGESVSPQSSIQATVKPRPQAEVEDPESELPDEVSIPSLSDLIRPYTKGRRVLFVSNRLDHDLAARLSEMLGAEITECEGAARRVEAQCVRIGQNSYDLVLSATGFQSHVTDSLLARATSAAGVPYVRVNRGRPNACVHAIAREFGLLSSSSGGAARAADVSG